MLRRWVNDVAPGGGVSVLTQPGVVYNLAPGQKVRVIDVHFGVLTVSDNCHFELGWTTGANGAGTFTPLTAHRHVYTGATVTGRTDHHDELQPPQHACYSDGARSVTFRVNPNDAGCTITCEWGGWWEQE